MDQPPSPEARSSKQETATNASKRNRNPRVWGLVGAAVLGLVVLRVWVQAYNIPAGGMFPTLQIGDHIFATRYTWFGEPQPRRGELMVFRYPDPNPNNAPVDF